MSSHTSSGIVRVHKSKDNPYAVILKSIYEDKRLTFKAKGILSTLLAQPDNWQVNTNWLISTSADGRDSVLSGLKELEICGYLVRAWERDIHGHFQWFSEIYEEPRENPLNDSHFLDQYSDTGLGSEVGTSPVVGISRYGDPVSGKPVSLISNDLTSNELINNKESALRASRKTAVTASNGSSDPVSPDSRCDPPTGLEESTHAGYGGKRPTPTTVPEDFTPNASTRRMWVKECERCKVPLDAFDIDHQTRAFISYYQTTPDRNSGELIHSANWDQMFWRWMLKRIEYYMRDGREGAARARQREKAVVKQEVQSAQNNRDEYNTPGGKYYEVFHRDR